MPAEKLLVIGDSGDGKSSALRNLDPTSTFLINCVSKDLPFRGWKKNYTSCTKSNPSGNVLNENKAENIKKTLLAINEKMPQIKTIIIDDFNYVAAYQLFDKIDETGYNKFSHLAKDLKDIASLAEKFRDDLFIVIMMHPDISVNPVTGEKIIKPKVAGKMVENQLTFEGLFAKVLYCKPQVDMIENKITYGFYTRKTADNPQSPAKTPFGLFEEEFIDNDLQLVIDEVQRFNNGD